MPPRDTFTRTVAGLGRLVEAISPWLLDLGGWIFGALIAFNLLILAALLTVGPVDPAVKVATAAFALALPPDVAGFLLLRLVTDLRKGNLAEVATKALVEEGFQVEGADPQEVTEKRVSASTLRYSYVLLSLALALTLIGVTAALWHMAWWIGAAFIVMAVVSNVVVIAALAAFKPGGRWRSPAGETEPQKK